MELFELSCAPLSLARPLLQPPSLAGADIRNGLVLDLDFSTASTGFIQDQSQLRNNGSVTGALPNNQSGSAGVSGGIAPRGLFFDAVDDLVSCGSAASLTNLATFTIESFVNPKSIGEGNAGRIVDKGSSFIFVTIAQNTIKFQANHSGASNLHRTANNDAIALNTWNHVVCTFSGATITAANYRLYVNGSETSYQASTNGAGSILSNVGSNLTVGQIAGLTTRTFDGSIGLFRLYNRALSAEEVRLRYGHTVVRFGGAV